MTTKYSVPTVESILEDSEDEGTGEIKDSESNSSDEETQCQPRVTHDKPMETHRRERHRRVHKRTSSGGRHVHRTRTTYRAGETTSRDIESDGPRRRHRRRRSNRSDRSASESSSDEEEPAQDHRAVLAAARERLSSPSTISAFTTLTTLTTATNTSGGSSGSNSTVTQASITKKSMGKKPEQPEPPLSPAVPDPPNVFTFLDNEASAEVPDGDEEEHDEEDEESESDSGEENDDPGEGPSNWESHQSASAYVPLPTESSPQNSSSSSAASSFHGDDSFSQPADHDTDRSTSPEQSVKGSNEPREAQAATDPVSAKVAAQMAAAQQRQNYYATQQFGTPNMPRGNYQLPVVSPSALSARYHQQQVMPHALPRAEKLPITGYELLASRLSYSREAEERGDRIRPMYRKFEALNHRLLLHLQDEISELEEQLHRLDHADTQSRRTERFIVPASRRAAAQAGGELQWHKTDILGKIGFKLAQYNQALSSFNSTQSLSPPDPEDIDFYRSYLASEHPITDVETHFLDPADDLVSVASDTLPAMRQQYLSSPSYETSSSSDVETSQIPSASLQLSTPLHPQAQIESKPAAQYAELEVRSPLPGIALAIAAAILIPILTFNVIPNFIGRLTVALLVGSFAVFGLVQGGVVRGGDAWGREGCVCVGVYGGVMIVLAGIMG